MLGRLANVKGNVRSTLDKLKGKKNDLVRGNEGWKDWDFPDLLRELKKWTEINPVEESAAERSPSKGFQEKSHTRVFNTQSNHSQQEPHAGNCCVYCDDDKHRATRCTKITEIDKRKRILSAKRLFQLHRGKTSCGRMQEPIKSVRSAVENTTRRSVTNKMTKPTRSLSPQKFQPRVTYPVVVVQVEGIKCRALLDTGAGNSYLSAALLDRIPSQSSNKKFEVATKNVCKYEGSWRRTYCIWRWAA